LFFVFWFFFVFVFLFFLFFLFFVFCFLFFLFLLFLLRPVLSWCRRPSSSSCCVLQNVLVLDFNKLHTFIGLYVWGPFTFFLGWVWIANMCECMCYMLYAICYNKIGIGIGIWNSRGFVWVGVGCLQQLTLWSLYCCLL